ncbi:hypothetical protein KIN20_027824 [Parelaphostrongylus tenuis]|uniref:Uncharacterized protein n=1 Tax=Parelaphostrongylus tenuis TaxID=148309 RepID=A0AAD5WE92_PARTN|nr:hypothetical protein KIN20_027824 [Parelaphostrongylus tenuis]
MIEKERTEHFYQIQEGTDSSELQFIRSPLKAEKGISPIGNHQQAVRLGDDVDHVIVAHMVVSVFVEIDQ